jgi:hypothetical protein
MRYASSIEFEICGTAIREGNYGVAGFISKEENGCIDALNSSQTITVLTYLKIVKLKVLILAPESAIGLRTVVTWGV